MSRSMQAGAATPATGRLLRRLAASAGLSMMLLVDRYTVGPLIVGCFREGPARTWYYLTHHRLVGAPGGGDGEVHLVRLSTPLFAVETVCIAVISVGLTVVVTGILARARR